MESFVGAGLSPGGCIVRKKRSVVAQKPRLDPPIFSQSSNIFPPFGNIDKDQNNKEKVVLFDGLGRGNKLKKLRLKLGGVTHTIHTKYTADFGFGGGSSVAKSSSSIDAFTPQLKPLPQDDVGGGPFCSDGGNGFRVKRKDHLKVDSSSRKEYSSKGKIFRESAQTDNEPVRKSKRVPKRCVLDADEDDDEYEEIRFLGRLSASKVARSERIQMDDDFHGDANGEYKSSRLGKDRRNKSRSEKKYKDKDYLQEEEQLASADEPEPNGKKLKKGSLCLPLEGWKESPPTTRNRALQSGKDILTGSGSGFHELATDLLPAPSKRKEKVSEVERQLKKAEATQRRKVQSEKAAREAEAEAIRKILGQDSKKKKKEEKLKQQRDELIQGRTSSAVTLAPNTVRWVIGPNGTIVTFSDDIGLPGIFSPVPCSYPPPREKCAGPNCTNAYKYRDSKSKLPLCSLHCYRAIQEMMQPLIAC
ncbi:hypothetical protein ACE6H2_001133 [Prunus campanulata]